MINSIHIRNLQTERKMQMTFKWNEDNTKEAVDQYAESDKSKEAVKAIAKALETSYRSVIGKLVHTGDYEVQEKAVKAQKDESPSKKETLADIRATGFDDTGLKGATKDALTRVLEALTRN